MADDGAFMLAQDVAEGMYAADAAARGLGITIEEIGPGRATAQMAVRGTMINSHGLCHGGMIFALADTAFAYACNAENRSNVAMSCTIDFLAPGHLGEVLKAEARERLREGKTGIFDISVTGTDGRAVAEFRGLSRQIQGESVPGLNARLGRDPDSDGDGNGDGNGESDGDGAEA